MSDLPFERADYLVERFKEKLEELEKSEIANDRDKALLSRTAMIDVADEIGEVLAVVSWFVARGMQDGDRAETDKLFSETITAIEKSAKVTLGKLDQATQSSAEALLQKFLDQRRRPKS